MVRRLVGQVGNEVENQELHLAGGGPRNNDGWYERPAAREINRAWTRVSYLLSRARSPALGLYRLHKKRALMC